VALIEEGYCLPVAAPAANEIRFRATLDQMVVAAAIGDQVADRADLEAVALGKGDQVVESRHGPVILHDLADHAGRIEAREPGHVDRRLGMAGADEDAAIARDKRKDVARCHDVLPPLGGIDGDRDSTRAVRRRYAGRHAFAGLDRNGEGCFVAGAIGTAHQIEAELLDARPREGEADQATTVRGHEVDRVGSGHLRRNHEVALILPVLVVDENEHAAIAGLVDDLFGAGESGAAFASVEIGFQLGERVCGGIPVRFAELAETVGMKPGGAGEAGPRHGAAIDQPDDLLEDMVCRHVTQ
jgi:hypothetical protein